ncbi:hypothetical protein [Streptomyces qinzhouensis]|uniref:Secreted protein n=1 Tax=Streptomyces qinzhouensis TaxID=2599401 RepID=A0A5B8ICE8_9ACTN|nr:hypothetical protein [Streptomyces qinzhouensis]QDY75502.1 hypothetical protein FQU76_02110 [Streptomyces qinzhouensis]
MSVRKVFAGMAVAAAVAGAGLMTAPVAQAAPQGVSAESSVGAKNWHHRGDYATWGECAQAAQWWLMWGGASYFDCSLNPTTLRYDLLVWRP